MPKMMSIYRPYNAESIPFPLGQLPCRAKELMQPRKYRFLNANYIQAVRMLHHFSTGWLILQGLISRRNEVFPECSLEAPGAFEALLVELQI